MSHPFIDRVEARLSETLDSYQRDALTPESAVTIKRTQELVMRAGKRSRPKLLELAYHGYGGSDENILIDIAVALELHHQFLLIHDDIIDNDTVRYDGPNLLGMYRKEYPDDGGAIAESMALIGGNLVFTFANQLILEHAGLSDVQKVALLKLLHDTNIAVHAGQQLDIVNVIDQSTEPTDEQLLRIAYLKTSVYSMRQPMQAAAILLELTDAERQKIDDFARSFGILYQLIDDHADYFHSNSSFESHPKFRDFRQGKLTYPLLVGLRQAASDDRQKLLDHCGDKQLGDDVMGEIVAILERNGADSSSQQLIETYYDSSVQALEALDIQSTAQQDLLAMLASVRL